jgi:hypothetical protein
MSDIAGLGTRSRQAIHRVLCLLRLIKKPEIVYDLAALFIGKLVIQSLQFWQPRLVKSFKALLVRAISNHAYYQASSTSLVRNAPVFSMQTKTYEISAKTN